MATNMLKNKKKHTVYQLQLKAIKIYTRRSLLKTLIEWDFTLETDEEQADRLVEKTLCLLPV